MVSSLYRRDVNFSLSLRSFELIVYPQLSLTLHVQVMETPLDVLSRAASLVQPDTRESKFDKYRFCLTSF